jgi:hypothetical protein
MPYNKVLASFVCVCVSRQDYVIAKTKQTVYFNAKAIKQNEYG